MGKKKTVGKVDLDTLKLGDTFSSEGLFQGVSKEPVVWNISEINTKTKVLFFKATYFGIDLGDFKANINKKELEIKEL